jgi:hypothetical protein
MTAPSHPIVIGTVGGSPITVETYGSVRGQPETRVAVTLSANFVFAPPPGYPALGPAGSANQSHPQTIASGTTLSLLKPEAVALVAAGAATYS